jgi:putative ABC transport system permease protein
MFRNYVKIAWRNLLKHKADSFINIVGLCVAFSSALLLLLSVYFEFSYDRFHQNAGSIYRLYFERRKVRNTELDAAMPIPLLPTLRAAYPEVKAGSRYINTRAVIRYENKEISQNLRYTDPDFLKMFSFPMTQGNPSTALNGYNNVVLRKGAAKAIFGDADPLNKVIQVQINGEWKNVVVTGILDEAPDNSSIRYDLVMRFELSGNYQDNVARWDNSNHDVYIQLQKGADPAALENKLKGFVQQYFASDIEHAKRDGVVPAPDGSYLKIHLQPLLDMHTNAGIAGGEGGVISKGYVYLLLIIALLIIGIACMNFVNLSLGRSFTRTREIGLRKTLGAQKGQVAIQFWSEALIICLLSFLVSCFLAWTLLPQYSRLMGNHLHRALLFSPVIWLGVLLLFLVVTLLAGGYPAWFMSRFSIVAILKGNLSISRSQRLRHILVVIQFTIAVLLIVSTFVCWQQIKYLRQRPLGFNRTQVISIPVTGHTAPEKALQLMRNKAAAYPSILSVSGIFDNLGRGTDGSSRTAIIGFDYKNREINSNWVGVSYDLVRTLDLKIIAGRDFSTDFPADSSKVIINESMAKEIGEKNIVGTMLPVDSAHPVQVIGVVSDFNFKSLHKPVAPLTLVLDKNFPINYILVKVAPVNPSASMDLVRSLWKQISPDGEFQGSYLDENIQRQYDAETKLGQIFIAGAVIAIVLSCMGLLAIVILVCAQRIKEIGVRKVLGASVGNIVVMLSASLLKLILLSCLLAFPLAWLALKKWLDAYAYHVRVEWWVFPSIGLLVLLVGFLTISFQAIKAAITNPIKNLRTE